MSNYDANVAKLGSQLDNINTQIRNSLNGSPINSVNIDNPTSEQNKIPTNVNMKTNITLYNEVVNKRSELDQKIRELYSLDNSGNKDEKFILDRNIYFYLLWLLLVIFTMVFIFVVL